MIIYRHFILIFSNFTFYKKICKNYPDYFLFLIIIFSVDTNRNYTKKKKTNIREPLIGQID